MNKALFLPLILAALASASAREQMIFAEDDASPYNEGWRNEGAGTGFGAWTLKQQKGEGESNAGHFIAESSNNTDMGAVAINNKAFAMFANGVGFETAAAFRPFNKALQPGDSFSILMKTGIIARKLDTDDPAPGAAGFTLRNGNAAENPNDYNRGARFEIGVYEGQPNYVIYDSESGFNTNVPFTEEGASITVTLREGDVYDIEITTLGDKKTTKFDGRKLNGSGAIESFCLFNRDCEKSDTYFNGFQLTKEGK